MNCLLITFAFIALVSGAAVEVEKVEKDDGFIKLGTIHTTARGAGQDLYLSTYNKNYQDAKHACEKEMFVGAGELVSIMSSSIDAEVRSLLSYQGYVGIQVWTSGIADFDGWMWNSVSLGPNPFSYRNFAVGQDYAYLGNCVSVRATYTSSAWYSYGCTNQFRFICIY